MSSRSVECVLYKPTAFLRSLKEARYNPLHLPNVAYESHRHIGESWSSMSGVSLVCLFICLFVYVAAFQFPQVFSVIIKQQMSAPYSG